MLKKLTRVLRNRKSILENYKTAKTVNEWKRNGLVPIPINYPVKPNPRYGYGNPPHKGLYDILNTNRKRYIEFLQKFKLFQHELSEIRIEQAGNSEEPYWKNQYIEGLDAVALYSFHCLNNPKTCIEIGSGNSTKFIRCAIKDHGLQTQIISIDPHPRAEIDNICDRSIRTPLEDTDLNIFNKLEAGDILVFDGSHRCFTNSDVTVFFLEILPNLKSGVYVYIDDIYLPLDYPPLWSNRYYSEQYLLAVLLLAGNNRYEPILPSVFIENDPDLKKLSDAMWVGFEEAHGSGNGFWMLIR